MEEKISQDFETQVHAALNNHEEEDRVYKSLKEYSKRNDVEELVRSLRILLADPNRLHLFEAVRPFVAVSHQLKYDRICPTVPGKKLKTVRLMRKGIEDLGFKFRGGLEYGTGIFVSHVEPKSLAELNGLRPGDEIVRINGYDLSQALHEEVLWLLKRRNQTLEFKIRRMGLKPERKYDDGDLIWSFVEVQKTAEDEKMDELTHKFQHMDSAEERDRKVFVSLEPGAKLGCGIGSNDEWGKGIFVCRVTPGSVADTLGFKVGDQVMEVNGTSYTDISHEDAVMNLKLNRHLTVVLRSKEDQDGPIEVHGRRVIKSESEETPAPPKAASPPAQIKPYPKDPEPVYAVVTKKEEEVHVDMSPDWWSVEPETLFNPIQIGGRELKKIEIVKDGPLNMFLEGGNKTPLGGKIVVSDVFPDGAADRSKQLKKGDQIMMCEGENLIDVPLEKAEEVFKRHMSGKLDGTDVLRLIIAITPPKEYEDEITFF